MKDGATALSTANLPRGNDATISGTLARIEAVVNNELARPANKGTLTVGQILAIRQTLACLRKSRQHSGQTGKKVGTNDTSAPHSTVRTSTSTDRRQPRSKSDAGGLDEG